MGDSKIEIVTQSAGKRTVFRSAAKIRRADDSLVVTYFYEGDEVTLRAEKGALAMCRKGESELSARFVQGETTAFRLRAFGREGEIPLRTERYDPTFSKRRFRATLGYELLGSQAIQAFQLVITVSELSEEE